MRLLYALENLMVISLFYRKGPVIEIYPGLKNTRGFAVSPFVTLTNKHSFRIVRNDNKFKKRKEAAAMFQIVDEKKKQLDAKRPLPAFTLRSLKEKLLLEWTYHSNAIEGNTLTLKETKVVLEGITVRMAN